ncbi:MAG: hypothetical protein IJN21_03300 [Clostridia bacterium]|nr:hypothetical protein [Clostridia bacterium]
MKISKKGASFLALFLIASVMTGCTSKEETVSAPDLLPAAGVARDVAVVIRADHVSPKMYEAFTVAYTEELSFNVNGVIDEVNVLPGDFVRAGDRLVTLNLDSEKERAASLSESIERTKAANAYSNRISEIDIQILEVEKQALIANGASNDEIRLKELDILQKKTDLEQTIEIQNMNLSKSEGELEALNRILANDAIIAPFDGYVARGIEVKKGSSVKAYQTVVLLSDHSRVSIMSSSVSETSFRTATGGSYALIGSKKYDIERVEMDKDEYAAKTLVGDTVYAQLNITGPEGWEKEVEPGMYCAIVLLHNYVPDQLLIPQNAVLSDTDGKYVYVVGENGERIKRLIKIRNYADSVYSVVLEGLEEGEQIYVTDK